LNAKGLAGFCQAFLLNALNLLNGNYNPTACFSSPFHVSMISVEDATKPK
jgi:hypothetical protein